MRLYAASGRRDPIGEARCAAISSHQPPARKRRVMGPKPLSNSAAYREYLLGRYAQNKRTLAALKEAIAHFQSAIHIDPAFAQAYADLADSYGLLGFDYVPPSEALPKAHSAAQQAIALDESLAEAHTSLAMVHALYDWQWSAVESEFRRAIELNPGYATAHHWYAVHLAAMGQFDQARKEFGFALDLDPLSPVVILNSGLSRLLRETI